jgi:hypothetical protein
LGQVYKPLVQGFTPSAELRTERFATGSGVAPVDHTANNAKRDAAAAE